MRPEDLDYALPPERIAQAPVRPRDRARLLVVDRTAEGFEEIPFRALADRIEAPDLVVVNDTRVLPAKLRGAKESGGRAEALLLERRPDGAWLAFVKTTGRLRPGAVLRFGDYAATVRERAEDGACLLHFGDDVAPEELLGQVGEAPLPPYIERGAPDKQDLEDYQTIFARVPGAVAAPTAALHFSRDLAARLPLATVTLHVGPGTFRPIRTARLEDHVLGAEHFEVPAETAAAIAQAKERGGRIIAVGTTTVRALETTGGEAGSGATDLFIQPGHRFRVVDELITNFHLPRSTLLALVMALGGIERIRNAYAHAIAHDFRFYSYGDAMWIR